MPSANPIAPGTVLGARFQIERELARGGMGVVYVAADLRHARRVAVKVLSADAGAGIGRERFTREIALLSRLSHPNILPLFDSGEHEGHLYYVMPLVEGESLRNRLRGGTPLALDEVLRVVHEVADALEYAHAQGVVHRDVKPENILFVHDHALVADFGVAHWRPAGAGTLTAMGVAVGTPAYGGRRVD